MTNDQYEKLIVDEKIEIKKYDKYPPIFKDLLLNLEFSQKLSNWQKKYDLEKLFGNA